MKLDSVFAFWAARFKLGLINNVIALPWSWFHKFQEFQMSTKIIHIRISRRWQNWASYLSKAGGGGEFLTSVAGVAVVKTSDNHFLQPRLAAKTKKRARTLCSFFIIRLAKAQEDINELCRGTKFWEGLEGIHERKKAREPTLACLGRLMQWRYSSPTVANKKSHRY